MEKTYQLSTYTVTKHSQKERKDLKDIWKASDAHGYPTDNHEHTDKRSDPNKPYCQCKGCLMAHPQTQPGRPKAALHCNNCGLNYHNTSECSVRERVLLLFSLRSAV